MKGKNLTPVVSGACSARLLRRLLPLLRHGGLFCDTVISEGFSLLPLSRIAPVPDFPRGSLFGDAAQGFADGGDAVRCWDLAFFDPERLLDPDFLANEFSASPALRALYMARFKDGSPDPDDASPDLTERCERALARCGLSDAVRTLSDCCAAFGEVQTLYELYLDPLPFSVPSDLRLAHLYGDANVSKPVTSVPGWLCVRPLSRGFDNVPMRRGLPLSAVPSVAPPVSTRWLRDQGEPSQHDRLVGSMHRDMLRRVAEATQKEEAALVSAQDRAEDRAGDVVSAGSRAASAAPDAAVSRPPEPQSAARETPSASSERTDRSGRTLAAPADPDLSSFKKTSLPDDSRSCDDVERRFERLKSKGVSPVAELLSFVPLRVPAPKNAVREIGS